MPTYDYECRACGEKLEIFHSMTEAARKKCPKCGKSKLERLIGAGGGLIFKGSGFYITDYRSSEYQAKAKADSGGGTDAKSSSAPDSKSDAKSDSKSGAKPETKSGTDSSSQTPSKSSSDSGASAKSSEPKSSGEKKKKTAD